MDSKSILYSAGSNDECLTPAYAVKPILKYIPKGARIWCPFDTIDSEFVKQIRKQQGYVIYSHISLGQDFYEIEPKEEWDIIISNPPFTNKRKIFERALSFNKPFALLMSLTWLNDASSKLVFIEVHRQMQLLMFDRRIRFNSPDGRANNKITFSSAYYCADFLPKDIMLERLNVR